jgi:hypothetical protein
MSTTLLLLLSGVLIGAGVSLIWRDVRRRQRDAFVLYRDPAPSAEASPDVEITVSHRPASVPLATVRPVAEAPKPRVEVVRPRPAPSAAVETRPEQDAFPRADAARPSATAQQWAALQAGLSAAVEQVNSVLAGAGVSIGSPGEPSWSMDRAYGAHRRVLVGGESVAWLRLQCTPDGVLNALVKAHKDELAELNAQASAPASGLSIGRASDLLSECLKPTAAYAVRAGSDNAEQRASEQAWNAVDAVVIGALKAGNGALAQADARLLPLTTPAWEPDLGHHRMTVAVEVFGDDVARMHIDRLEQEIEVAVGVPEAHLSDLGRRRRIDVQGMTTHTLAELIASCAWPTIARHREMRRQA